MSKNFRESHLQASLIVVKIFGKSMSKVIKSVIEYFKKEGKGDWERRRNMK